MTTTADEIKAAALESKIFLGDFDPGVVGSWYGLPEPVHCYHDLSRVPHLLVAGRTGAGKSVLLRNYLNAAALAPESYNVLHITSDPDTGHATRYFPIEEASRALDLALRSIDTREKKIEEAGVTNWDELRRADKNEDSPELLVIMDGLERAMGDRYRHIVKDGPVPVSKALTDIMRRGRSLGVHLIATNQYGKPRHWKIWEQKIPPFATTLAFTPRGCGRAEWYEGKELMSPEFAVNAPNFDL